MTWRNLHVNSTHYYLVCVQKQIIKGSPGLWCSSLTSCFIFTVCCLRINAWHILSRCSWEQQPIFFPSNFWHFPEVCLMFGWHGDKSSCTHGLLNSRFYSNLNETVRIRYLNCRYSFLSCAKSSTRCQPSPACLCTCGCAAAVIQVSQRFRKVWKNKDGKRSADMEIGCDREAEMFVY